MWYCAWLCKDRNSANRHRRKKHSSKKDSENVIKGNEVEENAAVNTALTGGFDETAIEIELNYIICMNGLHLEDNKCWESTQHLNKDTARHCLVAIS